MCCLPRRGVTSPPEQNTWNSETRWNTSGTRRNSQHVLRHAAATPILPSARRGGASARRGEHLHGVGSTSVLGPGWRVNRPHALLDVHDGLVEQAHGACARAPDPTAPCVISRMHIVKCVRDPACSHARRSRKWTIRATGKSSRDSHAAFGGRLSTTTGPKGQLGGSIFRQKVSTKSWGYVPRQVSAKSPENRGQVPRAFSRDLLAIDHDVKTRSYKIVCKKWIGDGRERPLGRQ